MARTPSGAEHLQAAREQLRTAKTVEQMRQAQAVLLPLELGLSLEQTAVAIGRSVGATCNMRTRFMAVSEGRRTAPRSKRELRNRAGATLEREAEILDEVLRGATDVAVLVVPQLKPKIEARLGKPLALSSVYRMLARHGWRKLTPDTRHPDGDPQAREDWKKTPRHAGRSRSRLRPAPTAAADVPGRSTLRAHQRLPPLLVPSAAAPDGQEDVVAPVHLCLRRGQPTRRGARHPGPAPGRYAVHAAVPRRGGRTARRRQHHHGPGRCGLAHQQRSARAGQHAAVVPAAVLARTQPRRASVGRVAREALPQPRLRLPGCRRRPSRRQPARLRARPPAHPQHHRLAVDY